MISMLKKYRPFLLYGLLLTLTTAFLPTKGQSNDNGAVGSPCSDAAGPYHRASGDPLPFWMASSYPTDPAADIPWSCGFSGVDSIACAFNTARETENSQLGTRLPVLTLPIQSEWDAMGEGEKALWLINLERSDRGIDPLEQTEVNVTHVAQTYADYLLDRDLWGHHEDGRSPWERLHDNPRIDACHDNLSVAENLAVFVSSGSIPLPIERSVYMWIYDDAGSNWGHRHALLWYPYEDNSGSPGMEGFLGIGRATGGPYKGPFDNTWPFAEMVVMNVFDPCSTWDYSSTTIPSLCPSQYLYGEVSEEVMLLRWFRDNLLSTTPEGKQIIKLYYQWSPLLRKAMEEDKRLQKEVKEAFDHIVGLLRADMK